MKAGHRRWSIPTDAEHRDASDTRAARRIYEVPPETDLPVRRHGPSRRWSSTSRSAWRFPADLDS